MEWISFDDQVPELGISVLTFSGDGYIDIEDIDSYKLACITGEEYNPYYLAISHWMPLPPPPKS